MTPPGIEPRVSQTIGEYCTHSLGQWHSTSMKIAKIKSEKKFHTNGQYMKAKVYNGCKDVSRKKDILRLEVCSTFTCLVVK